MAAGIVYHNITTASGVTFSLACWVPDTSAPDVGAIPVSLPIKSDGTVADPTALATQATLAALLAKVIAAPSTEAKQDTMITALAGLHTDLATTLAPYLDGLEGLIGTSNSTLASILTGVATTLAGYVDGLETLVTSSNTKLDTIHTDLGTTLTALITSLNGYVDQLEGYVDGLEGQTGSVTETAPATDTASSGLNGRLQRIAQRITSLIALIPESLGAKTAANSLAVTLASDDAAVATLGAASGAAVITDANGTIQQYLRGLVALAAPGLLVVPPPVIVASATFTTPAGTTAYASGDLIANSGTAGSVTPMALAVARIAAGSAMIRRVRVKTVDSGFAAATVRVHFYKTLPTVSNGDNGVWLSTESEYLGAVDVTLDKTFSDPLYKGVGTPNNGSEINFLCAAASQNIYAVLEARGAYTPQGGKAWTVTAEVLPN